MFSDQFKDYSWIKVKRHIDNEKDSFEDRFYALDNHHVKETTFLLAKVRELASIIDQKDKKIEELKTCLKTTQSEMQ